MKKKVFALAMVLVFLVQFVPSSAASTAAAVVTDPADWLPDVLSLTGSHSVTLKALNADAEYYTVEFTVTPDGGLWRGEFEVPDCYTGLDVYEWNGTAWVLRNGASNYTLSVPYFYNNSDIWNYSTYAEAPPADWKSLSLSQASFTAGAVKRVQLVVSTSTQATLKVLIKYSTIPAVGFDGIDDFVRVISVPYDELDPEQVTVAVWSRVQSLPAVYYSLLVGRHMRYPYSMRVDFSGYLYVGYTFKDYSYVVEPTSYFVPFNVMNFYATAYDGNVLKMYVNDSAVYSKTIGKPLLTGTNNNVSIGALGVNTWTTKGGMGAVCIYNRSLSSQEISALYQGQEVNRTGLVLEFLLGNINGTTWYDSSGNGNHGTIYGNAHYKVVKTAGFSVSFTHYTFSISGYVVNATAPIVESGCSYDPYYRKLELATSGNVTVHSPIGFYLPFWVYYDAGNGWVGFTGDYEWDFGYSGEASNVTYYFPSGTTRVLFDFADDTSGGYTPPIDGGGGGGGGGSTVTPPPPVHEEEEEGGDDGDGGGGEDTFPTNVVLWGGVAYAGLIAAIALILVMGGKKR